ncbi:MAG: MFS transporter [Gammaproteobacteria bacterium]|nr:MFS transporter [Gammaproteobacteria bacterium]
MEEVKLTEEKSSIISKTSGLQSKDYLAYAMGDFAGCLCFATVTTLLQKYYTDILGLSPLFIMIMFMAARLWDAINDPIMGRIVDKKKVNKNGRYRVWMKYIAIPLALATFLMFLPNTKMAQAMGNVGIAVYAAITYIIFGMVYTMHQIPYGSLASVVTTDHKERNKLSVFRSVGAALGNIPVLMITFFWAKKTTEIVDGVETTVSKIQYLPILIGVAVIAVLTVVCLIFAYKNNKERVLAVNIEHKDNGFKIAGTLLKNRNFLAVSLAGLLLLAGQMFTQSFYTYLFNDMFGANWMNMAAMACTYFPMAILMLFAGKLVHKFGKKEICAVGATIAAVANLALFFLKPAVVAVPVLFLVFCFISGFGLSIITLEIWALATDSIDDVEIKTGMRNDGTSYSVFMFFRKLGQVVSAVAVNAALLAMGYDASGAVVNANLDVMYALATIIPAAMFGLMGVVLFLLYGLNRKKVLALQEEKERMLKEQVENNVIDISGSLD